MKRVVFLLVGASLFALTTSSEAGPRQRGGYGYGYSPYYYGGYGGYGGYGYGGRGYGYGGYGYGGYGGSGYGYGYSPYYGGGYYSPYWTGSTGWSVRSPNYSSTTVVTPGPLAQTSYSSPAYATPEAGLRIDDVAIDGPAAKANLRKGDIIIGVGPNRTQTLAELQQALQASQGNVELVFLNGENKKTEKVQVSPGNGKIGVTVMPVDLP